jgi:tripartite-type tricarboxylate transporter receptor subunit TctC
MQPTAFTLDPRTCVCALSAAFALAGVAGAARAAESWPVRPVRWIVPFPAGGPVDLIARPVAQRLGEAWGQPVVLDFRPGGGSMIGSEAVARAAPDGYTMLATVAQHAINPAIHARMPYDTVRDFTPVVQVASSPFMLVVNPALPARSVRELLATARARPGQLTYASAGPGSLNHLAGEMLRTVGKVDIVHVPYKGGAPAVADLVGGHVAFMFSNIVGVASQVKAGRLRPLAVTTASRSPLLPDLPTMAESGVPGFDAESWAGVLGPAGLSRAVVDRTAREIDRLLKAPDLRETLRAQGAEAAGGTPDQFAARITADLARWAKVARESGARAD